MERATAGRSVAARVLVAVEMGEHADVALEQATRGQPVEVRRAAWAMALGVLRERARVDAALSTVLDRPQSELQPEVLAAMRLGVWERLLAGTPDHAAVDQAVEVVRALGVGRASGFVNAVVRRAHLPDQLDRATQLGQPEWLASRWDDRYGAVATEAWCARGASPPPVFLVAKDDAAVDELCASLPEAAVVAGVPRLVVIPRAPGAIPDIPGFREGRFWVQDLGSVRIADLVVGEGVRTVLDACAAPGGKTLRLAAHRLQVHAVDRGGPRQDRLFHAVRRVGFAESVSIASHDWRTGPLPALPWFDAVLVDAPCSGLGTWRRRPDVRWRRTPEDLAEVAVLQLQILRAAATHVRPGGVLVYAVCSPEPEEGEGVVEAFLGEHRSFSADVVLHTAPCVDGEDAFHAVRMYRGAD